MDVMSAKLKEVQVGLCGWDQEVFGSVKKSLAKLRHNVEDERRHSIRSGPSRRERQLMACTLWEDSRRL